MVWPVAPQQKPVWHDTMRESAARGTVAHQVAFEPGALEDRLAQAGVDRQVQTGQRASER